MLKLNITWYLLFVLLFVLVSFPIYYSLGFDYPFFIRLFTFILGVAIAFKLLFLLKHSYINNLLFLKATIVFLVPFLLIYLIDGYFDFVLFGENIGYQELMKDLNPDQQIGLSIYIKNVTLFFAITAIISVALLPIKLIRSIFRQLNRS